MRAKILRPEEWDRINSPDLPALLPYVKPGHIAVVAVEDDTGEIVACVSVLQATHFEGLWIREDKRGNAGVFRALIRQAYALPRTRGEQWVIGGAADGDVRMEKMCHRLGGRPLPLTFYVMPVGE